MKRPVGAARKKLSWSGRRRQRSIPWSKFGRATSFRFFTIPHPLWTHFFADVQRVRRCASERAKHLKSSREKRRRPSKKRDGSLGKRRCKRNRMLHNSRADAKLFAFT